MSAGGTILVSPSWFYPRLRNFLGVYGTSAIVNVIALIWILAVIRTSDLGKDQTNKGKSSHGENEEDKRATTDQVAEPKNGPKLKTRFFDNITEMAKTCSKKRENGDHIRLWWCLGCVCLSQICVSGELTVVFQFAQKVYGWDAQYFSNLKTITNLLPTFGAILFPVILVNKMKLSDTTLGIIGTYSLIFSCLIKGGFLTPVAFYIGEVVSVLTEMMSIAFRTIAARLISPNEYGQVFTVLSCIQTSALVSSSVLYTTIFNNTLNYYPGLAYHTVALMMFMPYFVLMWIDLSKKKLKNKKNVSSPEQTMELEDINLN